jgi:hypothetical protein
MRAKFENSDHFFPLSTKISTQPDTLPDIRDPLDMRPPYRLLFARTGGFMAMPRSLRSCT